MMTVDEWLNDPEEKAKRRARIEHILAEGMARAFGPEAIERGKLELAIAEAMLPTEGERHEMRRLGPDNHHD